MAPRCPAIEPYRVCPQRQEAASPRPGEAKDNNSRGNHTRENRVSGSRCCTWTRRGQQRHQGTLAAALGNVEHSGDFHMCSVQSVNRCAARSRGVALDVTNAARHAQGRTTLSSVPQTHLRQSGVCSNSDGTGHVPQQKSWRAGKSERLGSGAIREPVASDSGARGSRRGDRRRGQPCCIRKKAVTGLRDVRRPWMGDSQDWQQRIARS